MYARARPSSPGRHRIRLSARGVRATRTGVSAGPASLPSQARSRTGRSTPAWVLTNSAMTPAAPSLAFTSMTPTSLTPTSLTPTSLTPTSLTPTSLTPTSLTPTSLTPTSLTPTSLAFISGSG